MTSPAYFFQIVSFLYFFFVLYFIVFFYFFYSFLVSSICFFHIVRKILQSLDNSALCSSSPRRFFNLATSCVAASNCDSSSRILFANSFILCFILLIFCDAFLCLFLALAY